MPSKRENARPPVEEAEKVDRPREHERGKPECAHPEQAREVRVGPSALPYECFAALALPRTERVELRAQGIHLLLSSLHVERLRQGRQ
jgi:hypothetical protein